MSAGLFALLDDIAVIAKLAAASIDDIGAAAGRASMKAVGVVVDDTAVTPRYVTGFTPDRELPIIKRIALGSLKNKVLFILPVALLLSQLLPQAITPILMIGAAYLCYEGAEKVFEMIFGHHKAEAEIDAPVGSKEHEEKMVSGAIRTDFILSAEIMAISLAEVADQGLGMRTASLLVVALLITALVYGVVALIVKMDDIGLKLANSGGGLAGLGRGMVKGMPKILSALAIIGTAAMLWVGGHIIVVGLDEFGFHTLTDWLHHIEEWAVHALPPALAGFGKWFMESLGSALVGLALGNLIIGALHLLPRKGAAAH